MIHNRQYIISPDRQIIDNSWKSIQLANGYYINYQSNLPVNINSSKTIAIIGYVWQTNPLKKNPISDLNSLIVEDFFISDDTVYNLEQDWCGRYLLIIGDKIYTDAVGSLGVFYTPIRVSSSLALLRSIENKPIIKPYEAISKPPHANYFAGTGTMYDEIKRLLPCQVLNFRTMTTVIRPLLPSITESAPQALLHLFEERFFTSLKNLRELFANNDIWLMTTAGRDSRCCIAAFEHLGLNFNMCTFWRKGRYADNNLPRIIARKLHKRFVFLRRQDTDNQIGICNYVGGGTMPIVQA